MSTYISVGRTVVGAFTSQQAMFRCIKQLAPGCGPQIKKCHPIPTDVCPAEKRVAKYRSNEARQETSRVLYLRPGEFEL